MATVARVTNELYYLLSDYDREKKPILLASLAIDRMEGISHIFNNN